MTSKCHKINFLSSSCVCRCGVTLDTRRKWCLILASHNGFITDHHIVWPAPWSGNAIAVSGRGRRGLRVALARHILDTHFLRAINAEREWCARPHVCRARRRLAGGNGRERKPCFLGELCPDDIQGAELLPIYNSVLTLYVYWCLDLC